MFDSPKKQIQEAKCQVTIFCLSTEREREHETTGIIKEKLYSEIRSHIFLKWWKKNGRTEETKEPWSWTWSFLFHVPCVIFWIWFLPRSYYLSAWVLPSHLKSTKRRSSDVHTQKSQEMSSSEEHSGHCITQLLHTVWSSLHQSSLLLYFYLASSWVLRTNRVYIDSTVSLKLNHEKCFSEVSLGLSKVPQPHIQNMKMFGQEHIQTKLYCLHSKSIIWSNQH